VASVSGACKKYIEIISSVDPPNAPQKLLKMQSQGDSQRLTRIFQKPASFSDKESVKENNSSSCNGLISVKGSKFQLGSTTALINGVPPLAGELIIGSPVEHPHKTANLANQSEFQIYPFGYEDDSSLAPSEIPEKVVEQGNKKIERKASVEKEIENCQKTEELPQSLNHISLNLVQVQSAAKIPSNFRMPGPKMSRIHSPSKAQKQKTNRKFQNGCAYEGDWDSVKKRHGFGTFLWEDGSKYTGQWVNNRATGQGRYESENGDVYEGEWLEDKACGIGTFTSSEGSVYTGDWKNDLQHGMGREVWPDGVTYEGQFVQGNKEGRGKQTFPNGAVYDGSFLNNTISGSGRFTTSSGKEFEGDWVDSKLEGFGTIKWTDGSIFRGTFKEGRREGPGESFMATGELVKSVYLNNRVVTQLSEKSEVIRRIPEEAIGSGDGTSDVIAVEGN